MYLQLHKKIGPRLYTRFDAAYLRSEIEPVLETSESIDLDFSDVEMVSPSFADECFAKLLFKVSAEEIKNRIRFRNASPLIESIFRGALNERMIYA